MDIEAIIETGNIQLLQRLIDNGTITIDYIHYEYGVCYMWNLIGMAVRYNKYDIVKILISKGVDVNYCNNIQESILQMAVISSSIDVIALLISHGANYNYFSHQFSYTPIEIIICCGMINEFIAIVDIVGIHNIKFNHSDLIQKINQFGFFIVRNTFDNNAKENQQIILRELHNLGKIDMSHPTNIFNTMKHKDLEYTDFIDFCFNFDPDIEKKTLMTYLQKLFTHNIITKKQKDSYYKSITKWFCKKQRQAERKITNIMFSYKEQINPDILKNIISFI